MYQRFVTMKLPCAFFLLILAYIRLALGGKEDSSAFWLQEGLRDLKANVGKRLNLNRAKNVILFIGDGFGIPAITAGRVYRAQTEKLDIDQASMSFEDFPFTGISKTYDLDRHTTDSAASATAFLCGVKAHYSTVGVGSEVQQDDCPAATKHPVNSAASWAIQQGKWAGVVTTTRVTHATPSVLYAHSASRNWEWNTRKRVNESDTSVVLCKDIARQLVEDAPGNQLRVILGGGRSAFMNESELDPEYNRTGSRDDSRNLLSTWMNLDGKRQYVWNREQLKNIDPHSTDYLLGLFEPSHLKFELDKQLENKKDEHDPSLDDMTRKAIEMLRRNEKGYFLLVESGRIDHAEHQNRARLTFEEVKMLDKAVASAVEMTDADETLIIVTADHSHVMSIVGYPQRTLSILGKFIPEGTVDGMPETILMFANGPAGKAHNNTIGRRNLTDVDTEAPDFQQPAFIPRVESETHGGEDVAVYARGPWAHLLSGTHENTAIAHVMGFAMCAGSNEKGCERYNSIDGKKRPSNAKGPHSQGSGTFAVVSIFILSIILLIVVAVSVVVIVLLLQRVRELRDNKIFEAHPFGVGVADDSRLAHPLTESSTKV